MYDYRLVVPGPAHQSADQDSQSKRGFCGLVRHLCQRLVSTDLFELKGKVCLIFTGYFFRWFEINGLRIETSQVVIQALRELFAIHGIPDLIIAYNGPQESADSFREFATKYGCVHTPSSPRYPQANGEVERTVRTAKSILKE